jgi:Mrp family chromosome partitioning ATPase
MNAQQKNKRVVFTMGGKGGVGKTGLMVALAEWFEGNEIPFTLLDLDTENKARGSSAKTSVLPRSPRAFLS